VPSDVRGARSAKGEPYLGDTTSHLIANPCLPPTENQRRGEGRPNLKKS
jgi:hypothetical protein